MNNPSMGYGFYIEEERVLVRDREVKEYLSKCEDANVEARVEKLDDIDFNIELKKLLMESCNDFSRQTDLRKAISNLCHIIELSMELLKTYGVGKRRSRFMIWLIRLGYGGYKKRLSVVIKTRRRHGM